MTIAMYYGVLVVCLSVYAFCWRYCLDNMKRFLSSVGRLSSGSDVEKYKQLLKRQMVVVLGMAPFGVLPLVLYLYGSLNDILSDFDSLVVVLLVIVNMYLTSGIRKVENQIAGIDVASPDIERERDRIVNIWRRRLFPRFD